MSRLSPAASAAASALPFARRPGLGRVLRLLKAAGALTRQRRALAEMDDAQLMDIGLTRTEARREAERPFWDAPVHWR